MAGKLKIVLKKLLKFTLWLVATIIFLLVSLIVAIQIPAVQSKLINTAVNYVSSRTHTYIAIQKIGISFPKSVYVEGLLLKDLNNDTLIYAGDAKVNMDMIGLLHSKIHFKDIELENVRAKLSRAENDTTFNYNFLLTAFSDTTKKQKPEQPKTSTKTDLSIDEVLLKDIQFTYDDRHSGVYAYAGFNELSLSIDQLDVDNLVFKADELTLDRLQSSVIISKKSKSSSSPEPQQMPLISANKISIKNSTVTFSDLVAKQHIFSSIPQLEVTKAAVDLNKSTLSLDELQLAKSNTGIETTDIPKTGTDSISAASGSTNGWVVVAKKIKLDDNRFAYNIVNKPGLQKVFDAAHLHYKGISADAEDILYSTDKITANVHSFAAADSTYFVLKEFSTAFVMNKNSITASKLVVKTNNSSITADAGIKYSSLSAIADSIGKLYVNANLKKTTIHTRDILYFSPQLIKQPFFSSAANSVAVSGKINGTIDHLSGQEVVINAGEKTELITDFTITGLPDAENAYFDVPELSVTSGNRDIQKLAGDSLLPKSMTLPEELKLNGKFKGKIKNFDAAFDLKSDFGNAEVAGNIDNAENFSGNVHVHAFNVARLLNDTTHLFGPVTLNAVVNGHGLSKETLRAKITADAPEFYLYKYNYHRLSIDGTASGQTFEGKINLDDPNASLDFDGIVNMAKDSEQYKFNLNLKGADLQKLNISKNDFRVGLAATADLKGKDMNSMKGNAGITKIVVSHDGKRYVLDSFLLATVNEKGRSELSVNSAIIGIKYTGTFAPAELATQLKHHMDHYFAVGTAKDTARSATPQHFTFEVQLHNHPIISEALLPQLTQFEPGPITGSFDSQTDNLTLNAAFNKVEYDGFLADNVLIDVHSDANVLNYKVSCLSLSNAQLKFDNFLINGKLADQKATINVSSIDSLNNKKLAIAATLQKEQENYKLTIDPDAFFMMNKQWQLSNDNAIVFAQSGFLIHDFVMSNAQSQISVVSVNDRLNDDIKAEIKNFKLQDVSRIIEKDTSLAEGTLNGTVLLKRVNNAYGIVSDISIKQLAIRKVPVGDLTLKADNPTTEKFNIELALEGNGNNMNAKGYFLPNATADALNLDIDIQSLALKTVEAFSLGQISQTEGSVHGRFSIRGSTKDPQVNGALTFNNAYVNPAFLNNRLQLKNETITITPNAITMNSFTILDKNGHSAVINGNINMEHFSNFKFALSVTTKDFMLFNTTAKDNKVYYGRMVIDSKINVKGTPDFPVVSSSIKLKEGSNFTFAVPESKLSTDRGDGVVLFIDSLSVNPIITRDEKTVKQKATLKDFDISSTIEIDKKATLRLLLDPSSNDSLVVKGDAALSFALDPSGKISLTGAYNLTDGSYLVSLENVVKKKFEIEAGSTIVWNGDPLDADVNINAIYSIRAAPIDLVADQLAGLSESDQAGYRQRYQFYVYLKLKGALMKPEISFEIQLAPEDKGAMGGSVNAKLQQLNEDPSALNKQVFALLVLNRFIQENPLQTETDPAGNVARTTVSKFLSAELNKLSSKVVPGVELNFDVQSYDDYTSGQVQGRTQVEVGVKKNLFADRASVQVGGTVDVEGEKAQQNNASDITGDVTVEYKLTKDGRYRIKAFRHNQYEGVIEGQLVETGAGVLYVRDFDKWKELLYRSKKKKQLEEKAKQKTEQKPEEPSQDPTNETPGNN